MAVHDRNNRTHTVVMTIAVPREKFWRCLTNSDLLKQWYSQLPWQVKQAEIDVCPGGVQAITLSGPDGKKLTVTEVFLEVIEGQKLVFTDAFEKGWIPSSKASRVTELQLETVPQGTRLSLSVAYWNPVDLEFQDKNFDEGWHQAVGRIEELCRGL